MKKLYFLLIVFVLSSSNSYSQYTAIPDPAFEQELIDQGYDTSIDGQVLTSAINTITVLTIQSNTNNIVNLTGIEGFTSLEELVFSGNSLQSINLSQNLYLKKIWIINALVTSLDFSSNLVLENLVLGDLYQLTTLNILNNVNLKKLDIVNTQLLTQLNTTNNVNLERLNLIDDQISQIDITHNTALKYLYSRGNPITTIDLTHNVLLETLYLFINNLTTLDVSHNTLLKLLRVGITSITSIDVSQNFLLEDLGCSNSLITTLSVNNNAFLNKLSCENWLPYPNYNNITTLVVQNGANTLLNGTYSVGTINPTYFNRFDSTNNPNLHCIFVDDVANCTTNWLGKDSTSNYVSTQQECNNLQNEEFITNSFSIYPNPVNELLFIENNHNNVIQKMVIYDLMGKTVLEQNGNSKQLNFSNITSGLYLIKIITEKETVIKKIVKK